MIKNLKKVVTVNHKKFIATLTYAEPGLTEEDYKYLSNIIFNTKNTKAYENK